MDRMAFEELKKWKNKKRRKPLLVTGVRQCGKTFLIKAFAESEFEDLAYFNFDGNEGLKSVFDYDFDTDRIIDELGSVVRGKKITPGATLVFFDEIQDCPRAIQSLKYFCENMSDLHIVAAGSLLGVSLRKEGISFPVGKVDRLEMFPMSFEEFVIADGGNKYIDGLSKLPYEREIPELYTVPLEKYLKNYYIVGGMPEAVQTWIDTHDYAEVEEVQNRILKDYANDFGKHTTPETATKIKLIWDAIPTQIAKDNNKFIFSHVKSGARAKDLEDALEWIVNAGLAYKLNMVPTPEIPLSGMADNTYFKVYMSDVGLLRKKSNINYRTILDGDAAFIHFKGALTENYVMVQLCSMGIQSYFWRTKADAELDFLTDYEGVLLPIEVKAADNTKAKSLHLFCNRYKPKIAVKTSLKNVGDIMDGETHIWSIPLYVLFRLKGYIFHEMNWKNNQ
ncbi:ATP-binding protein [Oribacterium sp. NK2B42]|uniref:ATP-binding protein n=1 Tax=Oribacterium sp. NK2B42 TaxID=689781 RepID=UPI00041FF0B6|nr:AAA family ATPase [Oribacterium sp. NK2B42]